jgi:hypothetical protein
MVKPLYAFASPTTPTAPSIAPPEAVVEERAVVKRFPEAAATVDGG